MKGQDLIARMQSKSLDLEDSLHEAVSLVFQIAMSMHPNYKDLLVRARLDIIIKSSELEIYARALRDCLENNGEKHSFLESECYDDDSFNPEAILKMWD